MEIDLSIVFSVLFTGLYILAILTMLFVLVTDDRDPSTVLAWLFILALAPGVGFIAYLFLGRNYRRDSRLRSRELRVATEAQALISPVYTHGQQPADLTLTEDKSPAMRVAIVASTQADAQVVGADDLEVYYTGAPKFEQLKIDLAAAQKTITLMYLIWEKDELTAEVTDILLDRLAAGVTVVIMYDWLGSIAYSKKELRRLRQAGALVQPCYRRLLRMNYRNHMKITVIDGHIAYTGGMNLGQEYIDGGKRYDSWRDTHLRMTGPVVAPLQALTAVVWKLNGRAEDLTQPEYLPATVEATPDAVAVQIVYSSVWTTFPSNRDVFITSLGAAQSQVWIQSPYFVPDEPLLTAMCTAASSGIDVRFMMAGVYDKAIPWWVAHSYYRPLLESGVRIFQYQAGFLHSKTLTLDNDLTIVGSCNWDIRSIILHDEVSTLIHDKTVTAEHKAQYLRDQESCREFTIEDELSRGLLSTYRNSLLRLSSRLL